MAAKKRKSIRFKSVPMSIAMVDLKVTKVFKPTITSLVINESYTGCALLMACDEIMVLDQVVMVKVSELEPMKARVVWCKTLEENIRKVGVEFLE